MVDDQSLYAMPPLPGGVEAFMQALEGGAKKLRLLEVITQDGVSSEDEWKRFKLSTVWTDWKAFLERSIAEECLARDGVLRDGGPADYHKALRAQARVDALKVMLDTPDMVLGDFDAQSAAKEQDDGNHE